MGISQIPKSLVIIQLIEATKSSQTFNEPSSPVGQPNTAQQLNNRRASVSSTNPFYDDLDLPSYTNIQNNDINRTSTTPFNNRPPTLPPRPPPPAVTPAVPPAVPPRSTPSPQNNQP